MALLRASGHFGRLAFAVYWVLAAYRMGGAAVSYHTVVVSKGTITFALRPAHREQYATSCPLYTCTCNADVSYVQLTGESTALDLVNSKLRSDASRVRCRYLDSDAIAHETVTYLSDRLLSVTENFYSRMQGTGGSCHGSSAVHTFDLQTGKELFLTDIIQPTRLSELRSSLPASVAQEAKEQEDQRASEYYKQGGSPDGPAQVNWKPLPQSPEALERAIAEARKAVESATGDELLHAGFFIKQAIIYLDFAEYLFGCAGGSFNPGAVPASIISSRFVLEDLKSSGGKKP